ncbi:hypothetical protein H8739_07360 [Blautia faecis]|nr:hypothetical protein [Blautia faecis]MBC8613505.1 hypothetical protein [Blautia faecis]
MIFQTRSKARGCGIGKIKDSCEEAGNPMPEYTIKCEDIIGEKYSTDFFLFQD